MLPVDAAEFGTRDEAVAMVPRVQEYFAKHGAEVTFRAVNGRVPGFVDRDLLASVHEVVKTRLVAVAGDQQIVGENLHDMMDQDGKFFVREEVRVANTPPNHGWVDYRFFNPKTRVVEETSTWIERLRDNYLVGIGIYKKAEQSDGRIACVSGTGSAAIAACSRLLVLNSKDAVAYANRGHAYNGNGDYDRATADLDQAIRLDPKYPAAYNNRGFSYSAKGDYDRAIAEYDQAIRLDPKDAVARANRGDADSGKGDYDQAIADYGQAIVLGPSYPTAYNNRGTAYFHKRDYDRAIADYGQAIAFDSKYAAAYDNRCNAYFQKGDYDRAIADHGQAIELDPNNAAAYNNRGTAYFRKATTTTRSPTATRRSGSIRKLPRLQQPRQGLHPQRRLR